MRRDDDDRVASVAMLTDSSAEKPFVIVLTLIGGGPEGQVVGPFSAGGVPRRTCAHGRAASGDRGSHCTSPKDTDSMNVKDPPPVRRSPGSTKNVPGM